MSDEELIESEQTAKNRRSLACRTAGVNGWNETEKVKERRKSTTDVPYRKWKPFETRCDEVAAIRNRFPDKIPVIVEKFTKEKELPPLDKSKFLVPRDITVAQFVTIIRNRMQLGRNQEIYFLINNRSIASITVKVSELYDQYHDKDGFLYITYASQEIFG